MDFETAIVEAISRQFFEPRVSGTGPNGESYLTPSPFSNLAYALFEAKKAELLERVIEALDMDVLAAGIAERLAKLLIERHGPYSQETADVASWRAKVEARVIDLVAEGEAVKVRAALEAERT